MAVAQLKAVIRCSEFYFDPN